MQSPAIQVLLLSVLGSFIFSASLFFSFTAEDAYILYRYVENFHRLGSLIYNEGERINSLTSPLHALLMTALYGLTRECVLTSKFSGLGFLLLAAVCVGYRYRRDTLLGSLALSLILLPTSVVLWTFGGMETPLLLCLVALATLLVTNPNLADRDRAIWVCLLGGLGFLTRYDSALYFAPLALFALSREIGWRHRLFAVAAGATLPVAWLIAAFLYYGDIFPTSFYVKYVNHPHWSAWETLRNFVYIGSWLVLTGLLPALMLWYALTKQQPLRQRIRNSVRSYWPIYAGLFLELAYGLTAATTHMMFSFRFFAPFIPAATLLITESMRAELVTFPAPTTPGHRLTLILGFVTASCLFHMTHAWVTYSRSVNGLSPVGEYKLIGTRDFMQVFMKTLSDQADTIRRDWATRPTAGNRAPRLVTFAGGLAPYALPDAYVYEALASYRHNAPKARPLWPSADYRIVAVRLLDVEDRQQLDAPGQTLIFERTVTFDGRPISFRVYFNTAPEAHWLGDRIDRCCTDGTPEGH